MSWLINNDLYPNDCAQKKLDLQQYLNTIVFFQSTDLWFNPDSKVDPRTVRVKIYLMVADP